MFYKVKLSPLLEKNDGLSDKSLAAAVSVPLGIVIIVAVLVGAILIRKRMHNNFGSGESQSTTRYGQKSYLLCNEIVECWFLRVSSNLTLLVCGRVP